MITLEQLQADWTAARDLVQALEQQWLDTGRVDRAELDLAGQMRREAFEAIRRHRLATLGESRAQLADVARTAR